MEDLNGYGIVLGKYPKSTLAKLMEMVQTERPNKTYIYNDTGRDVFICGGARSGKNVGIIVPTLLSWKGSVIIVDKLFENWKLTADYRKNELNNDVFVFDPFFDGSNKINPFEFIKPGDPSEIETAKALAKVFVNYRLMNILGKYLYSREVCFDYKCSFGEAEIQNLIAAVILYLKYSSPEASIKDLLDFFGCDEREKLLLNSDYQQDKFRKILTADSVPAYLKDIFSTYCCACDSKTNHVGHFFRMIYMCLEPYRNEAVIKNLSTTDIPYKDLISCENTAKKPISLYLNTSIEFYEYSIEWLRFFTNLFYTSLQGAEKYVDNKQKVLLILDEITPYCENFCETLLETKNKNSRALLLITIHSLEQLRKLYFPNPPDIYKFINIFAYQLFLNTSRCTSGNDPLAYEYIYKNTNLAGDNINVLLDAPLNNANVRYAQVIEKLEYYKEPYWMKKLSKNY